MRRAVPHDTNDKADQIELPYSMTQECEGRHAATEDGHARKNDAPGTETIQQAADQRRGESQGYFGCRKTHRDRLAIPAKLRAERLHKNGKGVDEEGPKSTHHSETCSEDDAPSEISESKLFGG